MSYEIIAISVFQRQARKLIKKYRSLESEIRSLAASLKQDPKQGTPLGNDCYKIRLAISSKGKGKSGGARIITYIIVEDAKLYLLSIYDKADKETLTASEVSELLKYIR